MSSWRRTSYSVFPGPLESLPTSSHISPSTPSAPVRLPCRDLTEPAGCAPRALTPLPMLLPQCAALVYSCLPQPQTSPLPVFLPVVGICLIHLCIPHVVREPYRWTKYHWIRKWLVCLSLGLQLCVRILTAISVSDMRHKEGIRRAGMVPFQ